MTKKDKPKKKKEKKSKQKKTTNPKIEPYADRLEDVIKELFAAAEEEVGVKWTNVHDKKGVSVDVMYKEGVSVASARSRSIIKATVEDVFRFTQSVEFLEDVDPLYIDGRVIESLDDDHDIIYSAYSCGFFLISNRDFLYFEGRRHQTDGTKVVACYSIERDDVPPVKGYVRAHIYHSGWVIKPVQGDDGQEWCHATFCAQADPKGWIPHKLVNFFSGEIAKTIYNIQEYLEKEKKDGLTEKSKKHKKKLLKKIKKAEAEKGEQKKENNEEASAEGSGGEEGEKKKKKKGKERG